MIAGQGNAGMSLSYGAMAEPWSAAGTVQWGYMRVRAGAATMAVEMVLDSNGTVFDSTAIPLWGT